MSSEVEVFVHWLHENTSYDLALVDQKEAGAQAYSLLDEYGDQVGVFESLADIESFISDKEYDDEHARAEWS